MFSATLKRWASWLWPIRVAQGEGRSGPLTVRYESGRLVLNSENANQSFGALHDVWSEVLRKVIAEGDPPKSVLMLGLGAGSVPKILHDEMDLVSPITAVEWDPLMIELGRAHFGMEKGKGLNIIEGDATVLIHSIRERFDLVLVDLFDDLDLARGVDTSGFAQGLRAVCSGTLCFNTVAYDAQSAQRCERVKQHLHRAFGSVDEMRLQDVNRVFIAR